MGHIVWLLALICCSVAYGQNDEKQLLAEGEKKLVEQISLILEHYKQEDPLGVPGANIPDPMELPDMKHRFPVASVDFKNMKIYGISQFRILHAKAETSSFEANIAIKYDKLQVRGNYTMKTWVNRSQGPFVVNLTDVCPEGLVNIAVENDGKLKTQDIKIDVKFDKISIKFDNLGFMGSMFQSIINNVGTFLFDSIKPFVLKQAYVTIREEMDKNLDKGFGDRRFPNSISPLDMLIANGRTYVQQMGLDPFKVKAYNSSSGIFRAELTNTWLYGISSFYRVGNITFFLENNTVIADFEIGMQRLEGQTHWDIAFAGGYMSRSGIASFSVEYINARVILGQPLDTRKYPQFRDLQLEIGNIQVRCDGAGTVDYILEFAVNILPNLLRYQITDAIEGPIQEKVQSMFNQIQVEQYVKALSPELVKKAKAMDLNFDPSTLKIPEDEDEFWRFES